MSDGLRWYVAGILIGALAWWIRERRRRPAPPDQRAIVWSAVTLPPGTYTRAADGTWHPADSPDPARWSVTVRRPDDP